MLNKLLVARFGAFGRPGAVAGHSCALEAGEHTTLGVQQHVEFCGPNFRSHQRRGRNDVCCFAAVLDIGVEPDVGRKLLTEKSDGDQGDRGGVTCVDALVWRSGRVCGSSGVGHVEPVDCLRSGDGATDVFTCSAVDHDRHRRALPCATFEQQDFPAAMFFGRRTEKDDGQAVFLRDLSERDRCSQSGSGDDIVSTRMTDVGKGVVLGADDDAEGAGASHRFECRLEAVGGASNREAGFLRGVRQEGRRMMLFECQFWVSMDGVADVDEA